MRPARFWRQLNSGIESQNFAPKSRIKAQEFRSMRRFRRFSCLLYCPRRGMRHSTLTRSVSEGLIWHRRLRFGLVSAEAAGIIRRSSVHQILTWTVSGPLVWAKPARAVGPRSSPAVPFVVMSASMVGSRAQVRTICLCARTELGPWEESSNLCVPMVCVTYKHDMGIS